MVVGEILASSTELYKEDPQLNLIPRKVGGTPDFKSWGWSKDFFGLKSSILGFFGVGNNLNICGGTRVSPGHIVLQMKYNQICFATYFKVRKFGMEFLGGLIFGPRIFWGFDFAPISSSLLLEIQSNLSPPPPPPPWEPNTDTLNWLHEKLTFERGLWPSLTKGIKSPFITAILWVKFTRSALKLDRVLLLWQIS